MVQFSQNVVQFGQFMVERLSNAAHIQIRGWTAWVEKGEWPGCKPFEARMEKTPDGGPSVALWAGSLHLRVEKRLSEEAERALLDVACDAWQS